MALLTGAHLLVKAEVGCQNFVRLGAKNLGHLKRNLEKKQVPPTGVQHIFFEGFGFWIDLFCFVVDIFCSVCHPYFVVGDCDLSDTVLRKYPRILLLSR